MRLNYLEKHFFRQLCVDVKLTTRNMEEDEGLFVADPLQVLEAIILTANNLPENCDHWSTKSQKTICPLIYDLKLTKPKIKLGARRRVGGAAFRPRVLSARN